MQHRSYAGFWVRTAAWSVDLFAIIVAYYLFYLGNQIGAKMGWLPPVSVGAPPYEGESFSIVNVIRGIYFFGFPAFYFTYMHGAYGQTFGKMALHVRVLNENGSPIEYWKAFFRWVVEFPASTILGGILLGIVWIIALVSELVMDRISSVISVMNYLQSAFDWLLGIIAMLFAMLPPAVMVLWAAFDPHKQGLHDRICRTIVVRTPPVANNHMREQSTTPAPSPQPQVAKTAGAEEKTTHPPASE